MSLQDILAIFQTIIGIISLILSSMTLIKVSRIIKISKNKTNNNKQIAIGKKNKQEILN